MLKQLRSHFLFLRAGACQGRRQFDRAVALLSEANRLTPNEPIILAFLADAYYWLKRYDEALNVIKEGLQLKSEDYQLNRLMVIVLADSGASTGEMIPYIKTALRNRRAGPLFPRWTQGFKRFKSMEQSHDQWIVWAEKVLHEYEAGRQ